MNWRPGVPDPAPALRKPTLKRYTWSRLHNELLSSTLWILVARRADAPLPMVEAFVVRLENHANAAEPRGFVGDFSLPGLAAHWRVDEDLVARIYGALEAPDIGWIDQDHVVSFWARNPDEEDRTAAERQRRKRARDKAAREEMRAKRSQSYPPSRNVTRDSVTVTARAEQNIKRDARENAEPVGTPSSASALPERAAFADKSQALQWLRGEGEAILTRRLSVMRSKVSRMIERWSVTLGHDVTGLAEIILATSATAAQGAAFEQLVVTQVARRAADNIGPALPLPPVGLRGGGGHG